MVVFLRVRYKFGLGHMHAAVSSMSTFGAGACARASLRFPFGTPQMNQQAL
jgi:hypothetical protein